MWSTLFDQDLWLEQYGQRMKEKGFEEGLKKAYEENFKKGFEEGIKRERARIIANMKAEGMSDAQITKFIFGNKCN